MFRRLVTSFALFLAFAGFIHGAPVQDLGRYSYALSYSFVSYGQFFAAPAAYSRSYGHYGNLSYAPFPFVLVTGSAGAAQIDAGSSREQIPVSERRGQFDGANDISAGLEIDFYTPLLARIIRATAGVRANFFRSAHKNYNYELSVVRPRGGVVISATPRIDIRAAAAAHFMSGAYSGPGISEQVKNELPVRALAAIVAHAAERGAFLELAGDIPVTGFSDGKDILMRSSLLVRLGFIIRHNRASQDIWDRNGEFFPGVRKLRERQRDMAKKLEKPDEKK